MPREAHAQFDPAPDRPDPVRLLEDQARTRLAELVPIRYGRMLASPLAYLRGAALAMAGDLAGTPDTGFIVQACGDAHLGNFGIFASPERRLVFDINDFDETLPAPWEWDVKRLATSLEIAGRVSGYGPEQRRRLVRETAAQYRLEMRRLAGLGSLDVWYSRGELGRAAGALPGRADPPGADAGRDRSGRGRSGSPQPARDRDRRRSRHVRGGSGRPRRRVGTAAGSRPRRR